MALKIASILLALAIITNGLVNCTAGIDDDDGFRKYGKKDAVSEDDTNSVFGELRSGTLGQQDDQRNNVTDATTERQSNSLLSLLERLAKDHRDSSENLVLANNEKTQLDVSDEISHSLGTHVKYDDSPTSSPFDGPSVDTTGGQSLGPANGPSLFPLTGPAPRSYDGTKDSNEIPSLASRSSSSGGASEDSTGDSFAGVGIGCFDSSDPSGGPLLGSFGSPIQGPGLLPPGALPGGPAGGHNLGPFGGPMQSPGIASPFSPSRGTLGGSFSGPSIGSWGGHDPNLGPPPGGPGLGYGISGQGAFGYSYNYFSGPGYGFSWQWGPAYSYNYISGPGYGFVWQWGPGFSYNYISTPGYGISDQGPGYLYSHNSIPGQSGPGYPYNQLTSSGSSFVGQMDSSYPQKNSNNPDHNLEGPGYQHIYPSIDWR